MIATWFGCGYFPGVPGTFGSAVAAAMAYPILVYGGPFALSMAAILVFAIGIWAADQHCRLIEQHDPRPVVVDEVAGQWITLVAAPIDPIAFVVGFFLFRFFDIFKPFPISWIDKNVMGGFGVMFDDVVAGIFAGVVMLILVQLELFSVLPWYSVQ